MKFYLYRFAPTLLLLIKLLVFPNDMVASPGPFVSTSNKGVISRIDSIATHESLFGTIVNILGNAKINNYVTKTLESPPQILVDILCAAESLETTKITVESPNLKGLRIGHHPQKIRLVLDVKGADLPYFTTQSVDNELTIAIWSKKTIPPKDGMPDKVLGPKSGKKITIPKKAIPNEALSAKSGKEITSLQKVSPSEVSGPKSDEEITSQKKASYNEVPSPKGAKEINALNQPEALKADAQQQNTAFSGTENTAVKKIDFVPPATKGYRIDTDAKETRYDVRIVESSDSAGSKTAIYKNNLTQMVPDDGRDDTAFLIESLNAFEAQDWPGAIKNITHLITTNPAGRYSERAYFLLAKVYEQQYSHSISDHFDEIKKYYEDASYKFPASEYLPEAFLGLGNICFKIGNDYEALAYYNLAAKKGKGSSLAARALIQKIKIMLRTGRKREALSVSSVLENVVSRLPDMPVKTEAKILRGKLLYESNSFRKSVDILSGLLNADPQNVYQYPTILLYLGYNYYQLEDNKKSRENLIRFYNSRPNQEMNYLILAQIGDTYRNEGRTKEAVKFYQLVLKRYPNTEGAVISKIRLAELQEEQTVVVNKRIVPSFNILDEDMALATEFYKEIISNPLNKKNETPLTQLALLKLSIIYQKEKEYQKSLEYLKTLFAKYPRSKLIKKGQKALAGTIKAILEEEQKKKKYTNIINFYLGEKDLVSIANAPEIFLIVGRAFLHQNFDDMGTKMFKKADPLLADKEKPPDLLFLLSEDFYTQEKLKSALKRLSLLIDNYPSDKNIPYAYRLKGDILLKQKKYPPATKMFSAALKYPVKNCERLNLLIGKAKALSNNNSNAAALEAAKEADALKSACISSDYRIYQEIGDLYFDFGDIQKAVTVFNLAIDMASEKADKISLMLKLAQCYWQLDQKEEFLALNQRISSLNDPFWSNLAKERMEEINFNWEMKKAKAESIKGEKI